MDKATLRRKMQEDAEQLQKNASSLDLDRVRKLVAELLQLKDAIAKTTGALEELKKKATMIETATLPNLLDEVGVERLTIDDHSVRVETEYYPYVLKENESKFYDWLREQRLDSIIKAEVKVQFDRGEDAEANELVATLLAKHYAVAMKQSIHPQTLKAFVRERLEKNAPLPLSLNPNPTRIVKIK